jgi:hypothetical protein
VFQYIGETLIQLGLPRRQTILEQKLTAGGLADQIDYMAERERSTERHLLEDVQRRSRGDGPDWGSHLRVPHRYGRPTDA